MAGHKEEHADGHGEGEHKKHKKHHPHAHPEHEHEEGWIVSFADNVLLMMGFFVILLAMNMGPKGTSDAEAAGAPSDSLLDFAIAVREAFHNPLDMSSTDPNDRLLIQRMRQRVSEGELRDGAPDGDSHSVQTVRPSDWAGEGGFVQFSENSSMLSEQAKTIVKQVSTRVAGSHWMLEVRGHASRWETWRDTKKARDLAYQRAWSVGVELTRNGLTWDQIRLVSCGDSAPAIARARTADEGITNQRTEILILPETVPPDPYNGSPQD